MRQKDGGAVTPTGSLTRENETLIRTLGSRGGDHWGGKTETASTEEAEQQLSED